MNEIGELSPELQAKLLTFLETKKITRVGGEKQISVTARIMAATNRDLEREMDEGRFRDDLFYRLNRIRINMPSLKDRKEDIPLLVGEILSKLKKELDLDYVPSVDPVAMNALCNYSWPGNIRELTNRLERAVIIFDKPVLRLEHFFPLTLK